MRVVSLLSSGTEIVCALGCENLLVGRSHECDFPTSVLSLPQCSEPKFPTDGTSYEIDARVRAIVQEGLSVYRVFADQLNKLRPNVIVTQTQCEVCAVSPQDLEAAACQIIASKPTIVSLNTNRLSDLWPDIRQVAKKINAPQAGEELIVQLRSRICAIGAQAKLAANKPRVAKIEWIDPLMGAGNWIPELIETAGGISVFGETGKHSPMLTFDDLRSTDPDVIIVAACGWEIEKNRQEMRPLMSHPDWPNLKAVKNSAVYVADGNQYFNRPGPRLVETLEIFAEILHPELFRFGHCRTGWAKL